MGKFIEAIINILQSLFGGQEPAPTTPTDHSEDNACSLSDIEIPSEHDLSNVPVITTTEEAATFTAEAATADEAPVFEASAQAADDCTVTIKSHLGAVNVRTGPRLDFLPMAQVNGGVGFELMGASEADPDGYRWFSVKVQGRSGWVRGDTVTLSEQCIHRSYITETDIEPPAPPTPTSRFTLPAPASTITQGYHGNHRGYDMGLPTGTEMRAAADGIIIRRMTCSGCEEGHRTNFFPCPDWLFKSEKWGYGYGNFLTIRHSYEVLPPSLQEEMDSKNLTGGFAYVLYAHFSQLDVELGQFVKAGELLGLTGNHGCSSAPHLHFEVKIGRDEVVDGRWQQQTPVNPDVMFVV